jgi:Family of unknown function (DUF6529)
MTQTLNAQPDDPAFLTEHASQRNPLITPALVGGAAAIALGAYGRLHDPTGVPNLVFVQVSKMLPLKAWLTTIAMLLAVAQTVTALMMWGKIGNPDNTPSWVKPAHRWTGTAAFLVSLPVAYHCLWAVGFQTTTTRSLLHSLFGCAFYGAFAAKMLLLRSKRLSPRTLPIAGGLLVTLLVAIWLTSSLWFFTNVAFPGF